MRHGAVSTITLLSVVGFVACFPNSPTKDPVAESGGAGGGTTPSSGGAGSTGGTGQGPGGESALGGVTSSGGTSALGGNTASSTPGGGGTPASGGASASGGATARAGSQGGGGTLAGGSTGGGCTDDPPPNQTPTCSEWLSYNVCSQDWFTTYCNRSCGRCTGTGPVGSGGAPPPGGSSGRGGAAGNSGGRGGTTGSGGVAGPGSTNPQITGSNGWASRYWDCCKPSCSWTTNLPACQKDGSTRITDKNAKSGCEGGPAYECYDFSPWYDAATNMSYGFAAHNGNCGVCYMLQFTGDGHDGSNPGASALKGQQMIVQAINIGNIAGDQFDLLIPGGGVGQFNGCSSQWGTSSLGAQYGGLLTECKGDANCMKGKCQSVFGNMPALLAGCNWFTGWFGSADNPRLVYKQVSCPEQIKSRSGIGN